MPTAIGLQAGRINMQPVHSPPPCNSAKPAVCAAAARPVGPKRQRVAAASTQQRRQWPCSLHIARGQAAGLGGRRQLVATAAAAGDVGDEYEEMLERRAALLRIKEKSDEELNADEDEELTDLTERLLKFGYLDDSDNLDVLPDETDDEEEGGTVARYANVEADDEDDDTDDDDDEDEEGVIDVEVEKEEEEEAPQRRVAAPLRTGRKRGDAPSAEDNALDAVVSLAERGGSNDMGTSQFFSSASPGPSGQQAVGEEEGEEAAEDRYPQPPQRSYRLPELLRMAGYDEQAAAAPDIEVSNILTCNSLAPADGSLYVCVPSADGQHDGHDWADEAVDQGAVAVLSSRPLPGALLPVVVVDDALRALGRLADAFYQQPSRRMRTVGVVGSYGKTTTSWLARGMFEETNERCGMIGTIEYAVAEDRLTEEGGVWGPDEEDVTLQRDCSSPFHVTPYQGKYPEVPTTPDTLHMHKVLAGCADRRASTTLVELEPASLADGRAAAVDFDVLLYTNTFADQEEAAGGSQQYLANVAPLFEALTDAERQRAVINIDDKLGGELAQRAAVAGATVVTFSYDSKEADIYAEKVKSSIWETEVLVNTPLGRLQIITPLLGKNAVYNVLSAVGTGIACGVPLKAIVAGIEAVDIIPGRCEIIDEGQPFSVVVDSASTPEQLSRLLDDVKDVGAKRVLLVFGCPGTKTAAQRAAMTQMAHFKADSIYLTNDSPGLEWPNDVITDMVAGLPEEVLNKHVGSVYPYFQDPHRVPHWYQKFMLQYQSEAGVYIVEDRFQAIRVAIGMAKAREVVIVCGKGHQDWQEYWDGDDYYERETLKSWFDDRVECRNALSKLSYLNGIKDLDRGLMPWTRYPEERDILIAAGASDAALVD